MHCFVVVLIGLAGCLSRVHYCMWVGLVVWVAVVWIELACRVVLVALQLAQLTRYGWFVGVMGWIRWTVFFIGLARLVRCWVDWVVLLRLRLV